MKALIVLQVKFLQNGETKFSVQIEGEASVPCLIKPHMNHQDPLKTDESEIGVSIEEDGTELFTVKDISYLVKKGVWKPIINLHDKLIFAGKESSIPWRAHLEDLDELLLQGYKIFWTSSPGGYRPRSWTPPGFDEVFNVEA